jgi:hypothetical protein
MPKKGMLIDYKNGSFQINRAGGHVLLLDKERYLTALGDTLFKLKNSNFLNELEQALGISLIQIGEVY